MRAVKVAADRGLVVVECPGARAVIDLLATSVS